MSSEELERAYAIIVLWISNNPSCIVRVSDPSKIPLIKRYIDEGRHPQCTFSSDYSLLKIHDPWSKVKEKFGIAGSYSGGPM